MVHVFPFFDISGIPCLGDLPPCQSLANSSRNSVSWPFSFERGALVLKGFSTFCTRPPERSELVPGPDHFSHDVHTEPTAKHCYATPRFMRRRAGPLKPLKSPFFTHSPPGAAKIECSERAAMVHVFSLVAYHVWAICRHASHSPTQSRDA
jgi:hypothetical protein